MRPAALAVAAALVLVLAACGSSGHRAAPTPPPAKPNPRLQRDLARIQADLAQIRKVTAPIKHSSRMGTPAVQRATGRFLEDLETSSIPLIRRNRLIDHAVAAVIGACEQCFQMLEAARPIPELAHPNA